MDANNRPLVIAAGKPVFDVIAYAAPSPDRCWKSQV